MSKMPDSVSAGTYRAMADKLQAAAGRVNGYATVPDPNGNPTSSLAVPHLANMHVVAIFQALRRAAARGAAQWAEHEWAWLWMALGWHTIGDKFDDSKANGSRAYDVDVLPEFWQWVDDVTADLDARHTVVRPLYLKYTFPDYQQAERDGWEAMKRYRPDAAKSVAKVMQGFVMPGDVTPPGDVHSDVPIVPSLPVRAGRAAFALVIALALYVASKRKRRSK